MCATGDFNNAFFRNFHIKQNLMSKCFTSMKYCFSFQYMDIFWLIYYVLCRLNVWGRIWLLITLHFSGVPLPLIGLLGYGLVTTLSLQLSGGRKPFGLSESDGRLILLGITTAMATASGYFLYLLSTKFSGTTCSYCLFSALLSFTLFFINLKVLLLFFGFCYHKLYFYRVTSKPLDEIFCYIIVFSS